MTAKHFVTVTMTPRQALVAWSRLDLIGIREVRPVMDRIELGVKDAGWDRIEYTATGVSLVPEDEPPA